ncbi:MAG: F0F1 ATP synthase subunit A [Cytophagaceae bacterium]|jgi:F-type H+-transporting ATPase subunit a|nr:F0F1 ATP synthase subunit A [Cytophagaceae bacterium]
MRLFICLFVLFFAVGGRAVAEELTEHGEEFNATEMIMHHIGDSHEWHIISFNAGAENEFSVTMPLPVILWHNNGLHVFMSSKFHNEKIIALGDDYAVLEHGHIYITDASGTLVHDENGAVTNASPLDFSITRNVASMLLGFAILLLLFGTAANGYAKRGGLSVPKGIQLLVEPAVLFIRDDIVREQIHSKRKADFFMPYLLTLFFFILINNLIGLVPFFPGASNLSGNISFTLTLAVISFLTINIFASKNYWKHTFLAPGIPLPIKIFIVPVEIIGLFTKPFALMLRLFANITAGHIIILSLTSIVFVLGTVAASPLTIILSLMMYCLEFLVAFLQAYIFTLLTTLFIGIAVNDAH